MEEVDFNKDECDSNDSSDTEVASETEDNLIPEPLTSLFESTAINCNGKELEDRCYKAFDTYKMIYKQDAYDRLTVLTLNQSFSKNWRIHRAGRITASVFYEAFKLNLEKESHSLFNKIMKVVNIT